MDLRRPATLGAMLLAVAFATRSVGADAPSLAWPDTDPARHARAFFAAFPAGEDAMRAFWTAHGSATALAQRPVEPRLEVWRELHGRFASLEPVSVVESRIDFILVRARSADGGPVDVGFPCDAEAPHGLVALRVTEPEPAAASPTGPPADGPGPAPTEAAVAAALLARADSMSHAGAFTGVVWLDRDGRTLASGAYGLADREARRANRLDTRFNLGSIDKIFTHVAILQLAQRGALSLDAPVTAYLDDYRVAGADQLTVRMLLEHRGGVPDVLENPELWKDPSRVGTMAAWYALVRDQPLRFAPGSRQQYSNGGFVLLGEIVARVSGEDYYDYLAHHVYAPAGMTASAHPPRSERRPDRAVGYTEQAAAADGATAGPGPWPCTDHGLARGSSAGGGESNAPDLVRFARALRDRRLLGAAYTDSLIGESSRLGIAGGSPGVNALLQIAGPYTLVVLANLDPPAAERLGRTSVEALRRLAGAPPLPRSGAGRP